MLSNIPITRSSENSASASSWNRLSALEKRFPRIAHELSAGWNGKEIDHYIDNLLIDERGDRMGFSLDVLDELMFLAGIRWHLSHLCGTVIESTSPDAFNFTGNRTELCGTNAGTWVLL